MDEPTIAPDPTPTAAARADDPTTVTATDGAPELASTGGTASRLAAPAIALVGVGVVALWFFGRRRRLTS